MFRRVIAASALALALVGGCSTTRDSGPAVQYTPAEAHFIAQVRPYAPKSYTDADVLANGRGGCTVLDLIHGDGPSYRSIMARSKDQSPDSQRYGMAVIIGAGIYLCPEWREAVNNW